MKRPSPAFITCASIVGLLVALSMGLSTALAAPVTLDFNGASAFNTYSEDGYTFTAPVGWSVVSDTRVGQVAAGTVTTTLTESANQPFNLLSMDDLFLAGTSTGSPRDTVPVISSTGASVTLLNIFDSTTFSGPDWTNISFVQFELTSISTGASVRLDNIVVETVPVPASLAALGMLAGLTSARRRRA